MTPPHAAPGSRSRLLLEVLEDRTVPSTFTQSGFIESVIASDLNSPISFDMATDGRIFFTEQSGALRVIEGDNLVAEPVLRLNVDSFFERGLLGVTVPDDLAANPFVYVFYTPAHSVTQSGFGRLSRFHLVGNLADPDSEQILLEVPELTLGNHAGGALAFGPDGKLYLGIGDNSNVGQASQRLDSLLGKILRLNPDGSIPADNPFFDALTGSNRAIWAMGLRNPFTFAFDPFTGQMLINDVGQESWEEINEGIRGANYGWPTVEGPADDDRFVQPILAIPHTPGPEGGFAITGGAFYNPESPQFPPSFVGRYFFNDFVLQKTRWLDLETGETGLFATDVPFPVGSVVGNDGSLYILSRGVTNEGAFTTQAQVNTGSVLRIQFSPEAPPFLDVHPTDRLVGLGQEVTFRVNASGAGNLTYQWQRNGNDIPGATEPTFTIESPTVADSESSFRVVVRNEFGTSVSKRAILTVLNNQAPTVTLTSDLPNGEFVAGRTYTIRGSAFDPETGSLSPESFNWRVDYFTGGVPRPGTEPVVGVGQISFTVPQNTPFLSPDVLYRVRLTVTDSAGLTETATLDLLPVVSRVTIESEFPNSVLLDGSTIGQSFTYEGVAGVLRTVEAKPIVMVDGQRFFFRGWSNGGPRVHQVPTPEFDMTLRPIYEPGGPLGQGDVAAVAVGAGAGGGPVVSILGPGGTSVSRFAAFDTNFTGGVRVATAELTGDGVADLIAGAGPGGAPLVRLFDGLTLAEFRFIEAFEPTFLGGVQVAAGDVNGDGIADVVVTTGSGGSGRVKLYDGATGVQLADFFGIEDPNFRGGAFVALGDLNGDLIADLIVTAGPGGGPRVAVFDGTTLLTEPRKLFSDFFAFEPGLRNGATVAIGDIDGDGFGDAVFGAGLGGSPRVFAVSGRELSISGGANQVSVANFFAGPTSDRGGVRVTVKDLDNDGRGDLLVGATPGHTPMLTTYLGKDITGNNTPSPSAERMIFESSFLGGVFVG